VKNPHSAENQGDDAGKKVSGIKRHMAVDTQGLPHALQVTTANVTDRAEALTGFPSTKLTSARRPDSIGMLVGGVYTGEAFAQVMKELVGASVEVVQRHELHTFAVLILRDKSIRSHTI
jgi:hypothetical protein